MIVKVHVSVISNILCFCFCWVALIVGLVGCRCFWTVCLCLPPFENGLLYLIVRVYGIWLAVSQHMQITMDFPIWFCFIVTRRRFFHNSSRQSGNDNSTQDPIDSWLVFVCLRHPFWFLVVHAFLKHIVDQSIVMMWARKENYHTKKKNNVNDQNDMILSICVRCLAWFACLLCTIG